MKTNLTPKPTPEGWIGSLNISGKAKNALIDLISGVRNGNIDRARRAEINLEKATGGWTEQITADVIGSNME